MRTYLEFRKQKSKGKTEKYKVIHVFGKVEDIGIIRWHGGWWQYVLEPLEGTFWSKGCLDKVSKFLEHLNAKQRKRWKKK